MIRCKSAPRRLFTAQRVPLCNTAPAAATRNARPVRGLAEQQQCAERQAEILQLDERIAQLQHSEQAQYVTISSLETSLDNRHAELARLELRVADLECAGEPRLETLREMSSKQNEIAETLKNLISDNQGQAQARAKIIESQRQQLAARHRRNLLKQVS